MPRKTKQDQNRAKLDEHASMRPRPDAAENQRLDPPGQDLDSTLQ